MNLTDYLAIYAAVLSTVVFLWNLASARPKVRVMVIPGVHEEKGVGAYIFVQNTSAHTVHLSSLSLLYPYTHTTLKEWLSHILRYRRWPQNVGWVHTRLKEYGIADGLPLALEARKAHEVFIPQEKLDFLLQDAARREIRAGVQDELWRDTYSKPFKFD